MSQDKFLGPSIGMPIIYCNAWIITLTHFAVRNSKPNVDFLTVFYHFEYHNIGGQYKNKNTPVWNCWEIWFPEWSASTNNSTIWTYTVALKNLKKKTHWHHGRNLSSLMPETWSLSTCMYNQKQALITCIYASQRQCEIMLISDLDLVQYSILVHI